MSAHTSQKFLFVSLFFAAFAFAIPAPLIESRSQTITVAPVADLIGADGSCNTGAPQCCSSVQPADSDDLAGLLGLLGLAIVPVDAAVGLGCSPLTVVGVGSGCGGTPVCCQDDNVGGLLSVGCLPIAL